MGTRIGAFALAGAITTIVAFILGQFEVELTSEVVAAGTTVVAFVLNELGVQTVEKKKVKS